MAVYSAVSWFAVCTCMFSFCSFHYNRNRSALLCKLMSDNSLLVVNSVNYFTMIITKADLFKVA